MWSMGFQSHLDLEASAHQGLNMGTQEVLTAWVAGGGVAGGLLGPEESGPVVASLLNWPAPGTVGALGPPAQCHDGVQGPWRCRRDATSVERTPGVARPGLSLSPIYQVGDCGAVHPGGCHLAPCTAPSTCRLVLVGAGPGAGRPGMSGACAAHRAPVPPGPVHPSPAARG